MTTFVYDNTEVEMTGRRAERKVGGTSRRRRSEEKEERVDELVEITPADKEDGSWKKFVRRTDLYEIVDDNE